MTTSGWPGDRATPGRVDNRLLCGAPSFEMVYGKARQLAIAQQVLDTHVTSAVTGRCLACGALGPCFRRETAMAVWSVSRCLPRRIPGLSQPERIGARRVDLVKAACGSAGRGRRISLVSDGDVGVGQVRGV